MTNTEYESVKAFLTAYRYAELDIRMRSDELERLEALRETLCPQGRADIPASLDRAIASAKDTVRTLRALQVEVECAVAMVESATLREILIQHYICGQDLREIAERMHYSDRHLRRLHKQAVESIPLSAVSVFRAKSRYRPNVTTVQRI